MPATSKAAKQRVREAVTASNKRRTQHGHAVDSGRTKTYNLWLSIKDRCSNPNHKAYHRYGGRGITVCKAWADDYEVFLEAIGAPPSPKHTLDRINNNRGYKPGNVQWATRKEQANNRENNVCLTYKGVRRSLHEWAIELGIPYNTLSQRRFKGLTTKQILAPKVHERDALHTFNGKKRSLREWAALSGVKYATLWWRVKHGKPLF